MKDVVAPTLNDKVDFEIDAIVKGARRDGKTHQMTFKVPSNSDREIEVLKLVLEGRVRCENERVVLDGVRTEELAWLVP